MKNQEEILVDIEGYDGRYKISNTGRVVSFVNTRTGKVSLVPKELKTHNINGYRRVYLVKNKKIKSHLVHRLIAHHFIKPITKTDIVCHKNDIGSDNRISNLYVGTYKSNARDRFINGSVPVGEDSSSSKLTEDQVRFIRMNVGKMSQSQMAEMFNVTRQLVSLIVKGKIWKHLA